MSVESVSSGTSWSLQAFLSWTPVDPATATVSATGISGSLASLQTAVTPRVDTWEPGTGDYDASAWSPTSVWAAASGTAPPETAEAAQLFLVDPGTPQILATPLDATASLLSTTTTDLKQQLSAGASLDDLAAARGVSHDDLIGAIMTDLPAETPGWNDVGALAEQVASAVGSVSTVPPVSWTFTVDGGWGPQPIDLPLTATAGLLSTTPEDLADQLAAGISLDGLAAAQGVSHDALIDSIMTDLPAKTPGWSDVLALSEQIASTGNAPPVEAAPSEEPVSQSFTVENFAGQEDVTVPLASTAALLSTTQADLSARLGQGSTLSDLAAVQGISHGALLDAIITDLPAETPGWTDVTALAEQIASGTGAPPPVSRSFTLTSDDGVRTIGFHLYTTAATLYYPTTGDLSTALDGGATLNDLATARGISHDRLIDAILADLPEETAGWSDVTALAEQIASAGPG